MSEPVDRIPRATAAEIVARLDVELARATRPVLLATDADGTIWDGDVGIDVFEALLNTRGVREAARAALAAEAEAIGAPAIGDATEIAAALYDAYARDRMPHDRAFAMMAWAFAGWRRDEVRAFAERVQRDRGLVARIRPELRAVIEWARARDVDAYVVSASQLDVVIVGVAHLGIAADRVVAMTPAEDEHGVLLPKLAGPIVYGEGKLAALDLARAGASKALLAAFGDSPYDAPMLRASRVPVAVTPAPALAALAPTIAGLVVLER